MNTIEVLKNLAILYAEDDEDLRQSITRILNIIFAKVYVASDGITAVELYKKNHIDVVLLDYVMPVIDGYEVAKLIRREDKTVPIIISSAYTDKEKLLYLIELNFIKFIEKPMLYADLQKTLRDVVDVLNENNRLILIITSDISYNYIQKTIVSKKLKESIILSKKEVLLIELLLSQRNQLFTKAMIEDKVFEKSVDENTLRNLIYRLRKKINHDLIITVKDLGYLIKS